MKINWRIIPIFILILFSGCANSISVKEFTVEQWNLYPEERIYLIDSLITKYNLIGMSRDEIVQLLGQNEILADTNAFIEYFISPGQGDVVGFILFFDENGMVKNYRQSNH